MKNRHVINGSVSIFIVGLALLSSCSMFRSIPTKNYYIINYTPSTVIPPGSMRPYPYALQIGNFDVQRIFNRQNILYRYSPNQIQYYDIERWAVRPDYMITNLVFKHLEAAGLTNRIGIDFFDTRPDFRIEGMVEALEKFDAGDVFFAHLAMSIKMLRIEDGAQVWEYSFDQRKQVYQPEMVYTVQSMSSIFQTQMDVVVSKLDSLFSLIDSGIPLNQKGIIPLPDASAKSDSAKVEFDESGFEIIPEKKKDDQ